MGKLDYEDPSKVLSFDTSDKTPILGGSPKKGRSKTKVFLIVGGLLLIGSVIAVAFGLWEYDQLVYTRYVVDHRIPDPEVPLPPSSTPLGVYTKVAVVSNGGPCAQVGVDVMSRGGNAVDAAIATILCDGVLCPHQMGVGGGFIMSIYNATTKKVTAINARETAPAAANATMFVNDPSKSEDGGLAVAIPGAFKGYSTIYKKFGGGVSWESLFEPTIKLCENGIPISEHLEISLRDDGEVIRKDPLLRKTFFDPKTGIAKKAGEIYRFPQLAKTLRIIAKEGADALYNGSLTDGFVEDLKKVDGIITKEDMANYKVEVEEAFSVKLKSGYTIHAGPPPSSGIILAYILRILDGILPAPTPGLDAHRFVEACKYGYGERSHLGDRNFVDVSDVYNKVQNDSYIDSIRSKISDHHTSNKPEDYGADFYTPQDKGTANIATTDSEGNTVVCTNTINTHFGSGFMSPSTGMILNNEMNDFSTPGVPNHYKIPPSPSNFIAPGKRPLSSMCPTVFTDEKGEFILAAGAAGGSKITLATSYVSALKLWYDMSLKEVIDRPRLYHQLIPMKVQYEFGTIKSVVKALKKIGHKAVRLGDNGGAGGSAASAIYKTPSGILHAMPDYRRTGNSSGY